MHLGVDLETVSTSTLFGVVRRELQMLGSGMPSL
jgi:hypothetical protein